MTIPLSRDRVTQVSDPVNVASIASKDSVVIGRANETGMIMVVMPPSVLGVTFMLLATNHLESSCSFVNALAYHVKNEDVEQQRIAPPDIIDLIRNNMVKRHGGTPLTEGFLQRGSPEMFDGLYHGEFSPVELAAVAEVMREIKSLAPPEMEAPTVSAIIDLWINAANQFVRDTEYLALMGGEGRA